MTERKANMKELDAQAKKTAVQSVTTMFQRPGQLEKVDQYKRRLVRKKASVEALLKSAMQQQLDGVRVGLNELHTSLEMVGLIENKTKEMFNMFSEVPALTNVLNEVREEHMRHSQYVTAKENLKHIFTVPDSVEKTKEWINEGKLLHTHQSLRDLENSRDDLLYEIHKLPNQSPHDKSMLKAYFADVEVLSTMLEKQLRLNLSRTLNTVRKEPTVIVTALRIVEREEKSDEDAIKQAKQTGFMPPGRPKKWKQMVFEVLEKSIASKIEGTQIEERADNKHWLIRYLELIRQMILEDLRVVKSLCVPRFPPKYNIMEKFITMYHNCLSRHLQEIIQNGLEGNEFVSILSWVTKTYRSKDMLGHPDLSADTERLGPLLPQPVIERLEQSYLKIIENNYMEWMQNTLKSEEGEWRSSVEPHLDSYSRTPAPIIIFQMIDQNLQVAKTISDKMTEKMMILSIEQVIKFGESFRNSIVEFKNAYFEDRKLVPYFTQYMILIVNNCFQFVELSNQLEQQYVHTESREVFSGHFAKFRDSFYQFRNEAGEFLLEEPFIDLEKHFEKLFTTQWLGTTICIDTICATLEDYFQDYNRLVEANFDYVVDQARYMVAKRYLTSLLSKRASFKEEYVKVADQIMKEVDQLRKLFLSFSKAVNNDPFDAITLLSEVLRSDSDMISFELHRLVTSYPDITDDHLLRLLSIRGDLAKSDIKDKIMHLAGRKPYGVSIFKSLVFPKLNLNITF